MKETVSKYLIGITLLLAVVSFLPWMYMTPLYYILRYVIMFSTGSAFLLTFSLSETLSRKFMRFFLLTIAYMALLFLVYALLHLRFKPADLAQLIVTFLCVSVGLNLSADVKFWGNIVYYFTIGLVIMTVVNCLYWAGGLYVPEYYMVDKGKNQMGGMLAIAGSVACFLSIKDKENRLHYGVAALLALLMTVLIRARSDCFAMLACMLFLFAKECEWKWKWSTKTVLTVLGIALVTYIVYNAFLANELHTFMAGGKPTSDLNELTSHRWERNKQGMEHFLNEPIHGEQQKSSDILLIHNYFLLRLVRYGIGSLPLLGFYIYFGLSVLIGIFRNRRMPVEHLGYVAMTTPFIVSLVEPNFPYGPGSVLMMSSLLFGFTLAHPNHPQTPPRQGKVLHICNDFANSKVHTELYQKLDRQGVQQIVYAPIRNRHLEGNNAFEGERTQILYAYVLRPIHRVLFHRKIEKIARDIVRKVDMTEVSCIHATTLFSDGAVALYLHRHYNIPYVVAVRNTDVNAFLKYAPHLWWVHRAVIRHAARVVFITPALQQHLNRHWTLVGLRQTLHDKSCVIANGLNDYWLQHLQLDERQRSANHRLCYVGNFDSNKNVLRLMDAVAALQPEFPDLHLDLVGGSGNQEAEVLARVSRQPELFAYLGKIYDKAVLQSVLLKNSIFAMPSKTETFGLVYVEALSQGLSVLYTKGEGIDGLFVEKVGEAVNPYDTASIQAAIRSLLQHPEQYQMLATETFQRFDWSSIAIQYAGMYPQVSCL